MYISRMRVHASEWNTSVATPLKHKMGRKFCEGILGSGSSVLGPTLDGAHHDAGFVLLHLFSLFQFVWILYILKITQRYIQNWELY